MQKYFWMLLLPICLLMTNNAVDSVQTGIAGIAMSHILHRATTSFWIGMTVCIGGTVAMYVWLGITARNALRLRKASAAQP